MTSRPLGLFDQEVRQRKLQELCDPLVALHTIVPWSIFRKTLESMRNEGRDPRKSGRLAPLGVPVRVATTDVPVLRLARAARDPASGRY